MDLHKIAKIEQNKVQGKVYLLLPAMPLAKY